MFRMVKHTVHLKLPKLFGKKKTNDGPEVVTEVDLEKREQEISTALLVAVPLVVGCTIGYLVGFKSGVQKGGTNVIVMKD
jgi:hypothetical protein